MTTASRFAVLVLVVPAFALGLGRSALAARPSEEPELDRSAVSGLVFCDEDGDGEQGPGELGLPGVRVAGDHGWTSETDLDGRWHLRKLAAGRHLVAIDRMTLPPGSRATTPERPILWLSAGLPARVDFGVTCPLETVRPGGVDLPPEASLEASDEPDEVPDPAAVVVVSGRTKPLEVHVDGRPLDAVRAKAELVHPVGVRGLNLSWRPGPYVDPIRFRARVKGAGGPGTSWRLAVTEVTATGEEPLRELWGSGLPPEEVRWDGTGPDGFHSLLRQGGLYRARLVVSTPEGAVESAAVTFGAAFGTPGGVLLESTIRGDLFTAKLDPTPRFRRRVRDLARVLRENPGSRLLLEVHTDDEEPPEIAVSKSRRAALLAGKAAEEELRLEPGRVFAVGRGSSAPLRPSLSERNRAFNRRIEVRVLPAEDPAKFAPLPEPPVRSRVTVQGLDAALDADGSFLGVVKRPDDGLLALSVTDDTGMRWQGVVDLAKLPPPPGVPAEEDPLRAFGGTPLREATRDPLVLPTRGEAPATAADLEVRLPPEGAVLDEPRVYVSGRTHPGNRVEVNSGRGGSSVRVGPDGRFGAAATLPSAGGEVEVVAIDPGGNRARVRRSFAVADRAFFLMALGDAALGEVEAGIPGRTAETSAELGDVFVHGRGALRLRGRVRGAVLGKDAAFVLHVDTSKRAGSGDFLEQVVDPARDYLVFADAAADVESAPARGPLYALVEIDRFRYEVGNVRAEMGSLELLRYDRALYGALARFEGAAREGWETEVRAFATEDTRRLRRGHDELRATGGSLYYLAGADVLPGSERLEVVLRERESRVEIARTSLERDRDYRVDYRDGRVVLKAPLSSTAPARADLSTFQPFAGRHVLPGHEVWLVATYEHGDRRDEGTVAGAGHVTQRIADRVEIGAGVVHEARDARDYVLYGGHVAADVAKGTKLTAEAALSEGIDGVSRVSDDGGLRFREARPELPTGEGGALRLGLTSDVGALTGGAVDVKLRSWWDLTGQGFEGAGVGQDRGTERAGAEATWEATERDALRLRFDRTTVLLPHELLPEGARAWQRIRYGARWDRDLGRWDLLAEAAYGEERDDLDGDLARGGGGLVGARRQLRPGLAVWGGQEVLAAGDDDLLGAGLAPRLTTRAGVTWSLAEDVAIDLGESLRWDGDHAVRLGLRTRLDDETTAYLEERLEPAEDADRIVAATVAGVRSDLGDGAAAWSEYRIDGGIDGRANRAVTGLSRRVRLAEGIHVAGSYERTQTFGGFEGESSRDMLSGGVELSASPAVRLGSRYELRWDREGAAPRASLADPLTDDPALSRREIAQILVLNGLSWRASDELTLGATFNYDLTQNLTNRDIERQGTEISLAGAWRPEAWSRLSLHGRVSRYGRRRIDPAGSVLALDAHHATAPVRETVHLASLAAQVHLHARLELTEKVVLRHRRFLEPPVPGLVDPAPQPELRTTLDLLLANRLAFRAWQDLHLAVEYRLLAALEATADSPLSDPLVPDADSGSAVDRFGHGFLAEAAWRLASRLDLGLGYDFADTPRALGPFAEEDGGGFFVRVTGAY